MKKILFLSFLLFFSVGVRAAQDEPVFFAEDFLNQSVITVQNDRSGQQCHAVRILPKWYLTAAHCVRPYCDKACTVTFHLLQGPLQAMADVPHASSDPKVFTPRQYHLDDAKNVRYDVALIRFDPRPEEYFFYDARSKLALEEKDFLKTLNKSEYAEQRAQWQALASARPKLLVVPDESARHVRQPLAVPDLRSGSIFFRDSQTADFYYFPQLHHYMGGNFGVEKGMSGGGVVLPGGHVIGVVSANLNSQGRIMVYNEKDEAVGYMPYSSDYFLFTHISRQNATFIRGTIASFHEPGRSANLANISPREAERSDVTLQTAFGGALTVRDITGANQQ